MPGLRDVAHMLGQETPRVVSRRIQRVDNVDAVFGDIIQRRWKRVEPRGDGLLIEVA